MTQIIAEFCQNHNGDLELLKEMVWAAKENGADYAKIQTIFAEDLTNRPEFEEIRPYAAEKKRLSSLELSEKAHKVFLKTCEKARIAPLTTVFARSRIPFVKSLGFKTVKAASIDCASFPMIRELAENFESLIISTGATFAEEVAQTAEILRGKNYAFLHCVSIYPTPLEKLNLKRMNFLRRFTPKVGLSDHTSPARDGLKAAIVAIALKASHIERHFTLLAPEKTKDGPVSINAKQLAELSGYRNLAPAELAKLAESFPEYESMLGIENPDLSREELANRAYYRGRFASRVNGKFIHNWEEGRVH